MSYIVNVAMVVETCRRRDDEIYCIFPLLVPLIVFSALIV
jgi:hypothetical protein